MPGILEIFRRSQSGPIIDERSFELDHVYATAKKYCQQYGIVYDSKNPVSSDDDLAARLYQASIDFLAETGMYSLDSHRIVHFSHEEILEAVVLSKGQCVMGEGKDRSIFKSRTPDSKKHPWFHVGTGIVNTDERIAANLVKAYGEIKQANSISIPALHSIEGQPIVSGPLEVAGAIRAVKIGREALRQAGRPGLPIANGIAAAGTNISAIAASAPQFGLRPSDGWLVGALAELKFNESTLSKALYLQNSDANIGGESGPLVGGYAGGPAETAVLTVAYILTGLLAFQSNYHLVFPLHITKGCSTTRSVLWTVSVSAQAISLFTREPALFLGYIAAGPMTKQFFYESAAYIATAIPSGVSTQTCHPSKAILCDHITPMEMKGTVELAQAVTGMKRTEANEIVNELLTRYEDNLDFAPIGSKYQDCYDLATGKPNQEYVDLYGEVKEEIRSLGISKL